ncbi:MAG: CARDB domain-containing protein [Methanobacterium sp.]
MIALIVIVIVLIVGGVVAFTYIGTPTKNNISNVNNSINTTKSTKTTADVNVTANQTGPAKAKKGDNITINYIVSNRGNQAVYNVKILDQNFDKTIGTLNPGETVKSQYTIHIPTDKEVQQDFDSNSTVSSPFFIGGFGVSFTDSNASTHTINANSLEIKLE